MARKRRTKKQKMSDTMSLVDNIVKESNRNADCYERAGKTTLRNPIKGLSAAVKCLLGGR